MDTHHKHSVSIKVDGDDPRPLTMPEGGTILLRMIEGTPTIIEFDGISWEAFSNAVNENLGEFLSSGNEAQVEAYNLFRQTLPESEVEATIAEGTSSSEESNS